MATGIRVKGLREMNRAFARAGSDMKKDVREKMKDVAKPVQEEAEALASSQIPNIGPLWSQMRTGVLTHVVYVGPKQRRGRVSRPAFGTMLMERAMAPALESKSDDIEDAFLKVLDDICRDWGR